MKNQSFLTVFLLLSLGSILSVSLLENYALAQTGMLLEATSERDSSSILVSGQTTRTEDVTITVSAPNGNIISVAQLTPDSDGMFRLFVSTEGSLWKQDGLYTITSNQAGLTLYKLSVQVEVVGEKVKTTQAVESSLVDLGLVGPQDAMDRGLSFFAEVIPGATVIPIDGHTSSLLLDITVTVTAPNGAVITVDQIRPDINGDFETEIHTGSKLWRQDGFYTITLQQGEALLFKDSAEVEIIDGAVIPEFGTIAVLILAVAIVSIIVVSARSRLSIMPKY